MSEVLDMAAIAALVGDPARANMLCALMDGRALTASELAYAAHVTPQTASGHLGKLARANLIVPAQQGRHRYFKLAGAHVAAMIESISAVTAIAPPPLHRLERAARASCRRGRRGTREPADRAALDRTQARYARAYHHADRLEQHRAHLRLLAARPHRPRAAAAARGGKRVSGERLRQ